MLSCNTFEPKYLLLTALPSLHICSQVGTDIDPLAVRSAARNAQLNGVAQCFTSLQCTPDLDGPDPLDQLAQAAHSTASPKDVTGGSGSNTSSASTSSSNSNSSSFTTVDFQLQAAADASSSHEERTSGTASSSGAGHSRHQFDLVLANILRGPLVTLAPRLAGYVAPGGRLVVSGILESQVRHFTCVRAVPSMQFLLA